MADARSRRRSRWLAAAALAVAALVVDTAAWAWACRRLDDEARQATAQAGWMLQASPAQWSGWPVAAEITLPDATLRAGAALPPLVWTVPRLALRLAAWAPTHLAVTASGAQTVAIGAAPPVPFTATSLRAAIDLSRPDPPRLDATDLAIEAPGFPVRIDAATLTLSPNGWSTDAAGITFPGRDGRAIDPAIATLRLEAHLVPPIRPMPTAAASAQDWRARGGRLQLDLTALHWGALTGQAQAVVTLDPALQPAADGTMTASSLPDALAQLAATGALSPGTASAAGAMLTILAAPTGGRAVTLPLAWHDGVLSLARFPLLRTVPLRWD